MDQYLYNYFFLGIFLIVALIFPLLPILLARVVAPKKPSPVKNAIYECGLESKGDSWLQFKVQYYIYALLFLIFDIETVFLYPWALAHNTLGMFAFVEILIFLTVLVIGFLYEWRKGALEWR